MAGVNLVIAANKKAALKAAVFIPKPEYRLSKRRSARAGDDNRLARLHDLCGLAVIHAGTGGDAERRDRNPRHEATTTIFRWVCGQRNELSGSCDASRTPYRALLLREVRPICFRIVSRFHQNGFIRPVFGLFSPKHRDVDHMGSPSRAGAGSG